MMPSDPGKAPFMDVRLTIPIKLTTDPWSAGDGGGDARYASIGATGYGGAEYTDHMEYQPELPYTAPPPRS